jgi:hypothetical protein
MEFDRVPPALLPDVLRDQLREMYSGLEARVAHEAVEGCAIRPRIIDNPIAIRPGERRMALDLVTAVFAIAAALMLSTLLVH